jgi:D-beta-D-heptose 7-phosphate kinase/D-beta-D-heptose 1-phosphate adenosyltransferase
MEAANKVVTLEKLLIGLGKARKSDKKIVFTNGCFDILHVGHVRYLAAARNEGDLLVVGLNSDASVRTIKGDKRPLVAQDQRAEVLASLVCVDYVVVFDAPEPATLIEVLAPDVLVKGADWAEDDIVGGDYVKSRGGKVVRVSLVPTASTSGIIKKIVEKYSGKQEAEGSMK